MLVDAYLARCLTLHSRGDEMTTPCALRLQPGIIAPTCMQSTLGMKLQNRVVKYHDIGYLVPALPSPSLSLDYLSSQPLAPNSQVATDIQRPTQSLDLLLPLLCFVHVHFARHMNEVLLADD